MLRVLTFLLLSLFQISYSFAIESNDYYLLNLRTKVLSKCYEIFSLLNNCSEKVHKNKEFYSKSDIKMQIDFYNQLKAIIQKELNTTPSNEDSYKKLQYELNNLMTKIQSHSKTEKHNNIFFNNANSNVNANLKVANCAKTKLNKIPQLRKNIIHRIQLHLNKGWNYIHSPIIPEPSDIDTFYNENRLISYRLLSRKIFALNKDGWYAIDHFEMGSGFALRAYSDTKISIIGFSPDTETKVFIKEGWNLSGHPNINGYSVDMAFKNIKDSIMLILYKKSHIEDYNTVCQVAYPSNEIEEARKLIKSSFCSTFKTLRTIDNYKAYFIYAKNDTYWDLPSN